MRQKMESMWWLLVLGLVLLIWMQETSSQLQQCLSKPVPLTTILALLVLTILLLN